MTQKELSYVEDAVGHEKNIISILNISIEELENDDLKNFLNNHLESHQTIYNNLIKLLEEQSNER